MLLKTIIASATPSKKSAIGMIRVSGSLSWPITSKLTGEPLSSFKKNTFKRLVLNNDNKILDEVVCLFYKAPYSFTGEDMVEICHHGNPIVANKIISAYLKLGCNQAEKGEFTKRAFLNKKMNLIQAESVNELINSVNANQIDHSLKNLFQKSLPIITNYKKEILDLIAIVEVNIDYPEYMDLPSYNPKNFIKKLDQQAKTWKEILDNSEKLNKNDGYITFALIGEPNVGKSSILNALIKEEKAIVSNVKGTTRDPIEATLNWNDSLIKIVDTAGIRESKNKIEKIGIKKSKEFADKADYILKVIDNPKNVKMKTSSNEYYILNKIDLFSKINKGKFICISAKNNQIKDLEKLITKLVNKNNSSEELMAFQTLRQIDITRKIVETFDILINKIKENNDIEIISFDLNSIYQSINELLGDSNSDSVIDALFKNYCLGK